MQTNNDTHDRCSGEQSAWCREFGAAGPRQPTRTCLKNPGTRTFAYARHIYEVPAQVRTPWLHPVGLPIFALGKGTSVDHLGTQYVQKDGGFPAPN